MSAWIKSSLIAGLVVYGWGMFSWMVLPWHQKVMAPFSHEADVAAVLDFATPASGVYAIPDPTNMKLGPGGVAALVAVSKSGLRPMAVAMSLGLLTQLLGAFLAVWMLSKTRGLTTGQTVLFFTAFGLASGWLGQMPYFVWWNFPAGYTVVEIADRLIGWSLAGAAVARLSRSVRGA